MRNNSKKDILERVKDSSLDLNNCVISSDMELRDKMELMLEVAKKVKNIFEDINDLSLFLKIFSATSDYGKENSKTKRNVKE